MLAPLVPMTRMLKHDKAVLPESTTPLVLSLLSIYPYFLSTRRIDKEALAALDLPRPDRSEPIPTGIYALPEIGSIGLDEPTARAAGADVVVGRANFAEIARGHINGNEDGLLKLVVDGTTRRILGCQIVGEGATELVHVAQMAMASNVEVDAFVERIFNFPTMAEAYRVAALDALGRIEARRPLPAT